MGAHITVWGEPDAILPLNPAGLTGVWAEENTRASLFDSICSGIIAAILIMVAFASAYWGSSIFGELQYFL